MFYNIDWSIKFIEYDKAKPVPGNIKCIHFQAHLKILNFLILVITDQWITFYTSLFVVCLNNIDVP